MKLSIQSTQKAIVLLGLLFISGTPLLADIFIYASKADGTGWRRVGTVDLGDDHTDTSWFCDNAGVNCFADKPGVCLYCHAQTPTTEYTRQLDDLHLTRYFPQIELRLGEGQETIFAGLKLLRERGRLVLVDGKGSKRAFPVDAKLLRDKSGSPLAIVYRGSAPPP